jgi:hypothetical protein
VLEMNKLNVLIIADQKDVKFLDTSSQSEHWKIIWKIIDYNKLHRKIRKIQGLVAKYDIGFVLYSRNDQVANRISIGPVTASLRIGYSSFSGIDEEDRIEQMKSCFRDFLECNKRLDFNIDGKPLKYIKHNKGERRTFSLIFDIEQLGDVRYGLPRILGLLGRYNVKATFF